MSEGDKSFTIMPNLTETVLALGSNRNLSKNIICIFICYETRIQRLDMVL
jgi:hypothetical protein